jgi:uncharacterized protein
MSPVSSRERIDVVDVLRGLALFGILAANMRGFNAPGQVYGEIEFLFHHTADLAAQGFIDFFISGKCISLFSFLFGIGFAIQMTRAGERGSSVSFYPRRLFILLIIGLVHSWFIWWGDILVGYALTGFLLLLFRQRSQRTIAIWALCLGGAMFVVMIGFYIIYFRVLHKPPDAENDPKLAAAVQQGIQIYRDGAYRPVVVRRFHDWFELNRFLPIALIVFVFPRFLAGLWVWRTGIIVNPDQFLPIVRGVAGWALALGLTAECAAFFIRFVLRPTQTMVGLKFAQLFAEQISIPAMACFYACLVLLLMQSEAWRRRLRPFGAVGRMALTNYLMQSLFFTWFYRLTHTFGKVGPAMGLIPTFLFFAAQIVFSVWWLERNQFGPAEWLWRSLTYGKWQSMRKGVAS